ncbi:MAG: hypothetical protein VW946_05620 [Gammaproteobacteria bacterium]
MNKTKQILNSNDVMVDIKPELIEEWILAKLKADEKRIEKIDLVNRILGTILFGIKNIVFLATVYFLINIINLLNIFH